MVLAELAMFPTDKGESKSKYVSQVVECIAKSGLEYNLTPMGTIIEGEWDEVMQVITACFKILEQQCNRVYSTIKIDYRKCEDSRMTSKVNKVQSLINQDIKHT